MKLKAKLVLLIGVLAVTGGGVLWWQWSGNRLAVVQESRPVRPDLSAVAEILRTQIAAADARAQSRRTATTGLAELSRLLHANGFLDPTAQNYRLIGPMMRDVARLKFEGKLQAVAEEEGQVEQTLHFGTWDAVVSYGVGRGTGAKGNPEPVGRALVAQLKDNQFLVTGYDCRVDFRPAGTVQQRASGQIENGTGQTPSALIDRKWQHRQFLRVEEGTYENGLFKFQRILNGDQTDWGLDLGSEPQVLRVSVATY